MEKGQEKIQKICETLRKETLEPALLQAELICQEARDKAEEIVRNAEIEAKSLIAKAKEEAIKERNILQGALKQAAKQTLEELRQEIENSLFNPALMSSVKKEMGKPETIASLIQVIIKAIEKEGLATNLEIIVPEAIPPQEISHFLLEKTLKTLQKKELLFGNFKGGAKIKIGEKNMLIEITDEDLENLIASYVRKDFRERLFK